MKYLDKAPFSVPSRGREPKDCQHGWIDRKGRCVMCGCTPIAIAKPYGIEDCPSAIVVESKEFWIGDAGCFVKDTMAETDKTH